jgi:hypothetical protein
MYANANNRLMRASLANYTMFKQFLDERVSEGGLEL